MLGHAGRLIRLDSRHVSGLSAPVAVIRHGGLGQQRFALALVISAFAIACVRLAILVDAYAVNVLVWDQWDFLTPLFEPRSLWDTFRWQHGPHRMGVGLLSMLAVQRWTSWNAGALGWLNLGVTAVAGIVAVGLRRRLPGRGELAWYDALIPVLFLNSSQWAVFIDVPDASHGPMPVMLVLLFALLLTLPGSWRRTTALLLVDFLAVYTGFGLLLGILAPALFGLELRHRERSRNAVAVAVSLAILVSFLHGYRWRAGPCFGGVRAYDVGQLPWFFALLFGRAIGATREISPWSFLGALVGLTVIALAVVATIRMIRSRDGGWQPIWVLAMFSLLFTVSTTLGRGCLGTRAALSSRYVPYAVPGLFAVFLCFAPTVGRFEWKPLRHAALLLMIAYVLQDFWPRSVDRRQMTRIASNRTAWADCVRAGGDLLACQPAGFSLHPHIRASRVREKLESLRNQRRGLFSE
jgi:hypothetical protein